MSDKNTTLDEDAAEALTGVGRVRHWLGLERNIIVMLAAIVILGTGEEMWMRYVPKYLENLGAGIGVIAAFGVLKNLLDGIYQYPGGWLADRLGRRKSLVVFTLLAIVGYVLYMVSRSWVWVIVGTFFVMAWSSLSLPAVFAIIGDSLPKNRRAIGFGVQSIIKRIPVMLGVLLGGFLIARFGALMGVRVGLGVTVALAMLSIFVIRRFYVEKAAPVRDEASFADIWRGMDSHLKRLLISDVMARWAENIPDVFIILYVTNLLGFSPLFFGTLITVRMITAIVTYIPVAKMTEHMNRKPFVLLTFTFFALFPLVLAHAHTAVWLSVAFVVAGLREIGEPARKALIVDLASESQRGRAVGVYYLIRGLAVFLAPMVGGLLWKTGPQLTLYVAFAVGLAGMVAYAVWGPGDGVVRDEACKA